jgi:hypothetical protein
MEMTNFVFPVLFVVIWFTIYDSLRKRHEREGTERLSILYHFTGWTFLLGLAAYFYLNSFGFILIQISHYFWLALVSWILRDFIYNIVTGANLFYCGDGKGGFLEISINKLARIIDMPFHVCYNIVKWALLIVTVLIEIL